jgi:L-threonylcarbamoyladenylate synthase
MAYMANEFDDEIVRLLQQGGVGLLPTDTIYGLSCRALDEQAVERIHKLKERDDGKPLIVLISDTKMLNMLSISDKQASIVENYWPGRLSVILPAPQTPAWLQLDTDSLAVRLPDHPELLELINKVGPIVSTSANLQGAAPVKSADEAVKIFDDKLDFYVDAGELDNPPSTLAVVDNGRLKVVRPSAVKIDEKEN